MPARRHLIRAAALGLMASLAACAAPSPPPAPAPMAAPAPTPLPLPEQPVFVQEGFASWYGASHQGHPTASGEAFDMNALTAAHRTLRFGVVVRVTNLGNGRTVLVRINDRGPHTLGRVIDLSARAARELDIVRSGAARVRIEEYASDQFGTSSSRGN